MSTPAFNLASAAKTAPKLAFDFTTASLDSRVTFTRTTDASSPATYINSSGVITTATDNQARFDYNPITLTCQGLLIEESRTNVATNSAAFNSWTKIRTTVSSDTLTAPDGTNSADTIVEDSSANATHAVATTFTFTANAYTGSVYLKAKERTWAYLRVGAAALNITAYFNLSTGAIGNLGAGVTSVRTVAMPNGWYRCIITGTCTAVTDYGLMVFLATGNGGVSYTGNGASGIYAWGGQLELGSFATSYIPTTTTALTRNADVATMTGANFSDWYNATQGTFRVDAITPASGARSIISVDDGTATNSVVMSTVDTAPKLVVTQNSSEQANVSAGTITANTAMFAYASYASNYFGIARPSARQVDTSGTVPTVNRLRIGTDQAGNYANGCIQAVQFWP